MPNFPEMPKTSQSNALIEALEPRQNRKRGDDLAAVEYPQKISPEIEKRHVKDQLDRALNKLYQDEI